MYVQERYWFGSRSKGHMFLFDPLNSLDNFGGGEVITGDLETQAPVDSFSF